MGFYLLVVHTFGNSPAPAMVGWLSDRTGELRAAVLTAPLVALLGGLIGLWGTRFVRRDEQSMHRSLCEGKERG